LLKVPFVLLLFWVFGLKKQRDSMPTYQVIYIVAAGLNGFLKGFWGVGRGNRGITVQF
jgi:hypothetical protein